MKCRLQFIDSVTLSNYHVRITAFPELLKLIGQSTNQSISLQRSGIKINVPMDALTEYVFTTLCLNELKRFSRNILEFSIFVLSGRGELNLLNKPHTVVEENIYLVDIIHPVLNNFSLASGFEFLLMCYTLLNIINVLE